MKKLEKKLTKKQLAASQLLARLGRSKFDLAAEAKAIIKAENKKLKYYQLNLVKLMKVKDKKSNKYVYQIEANLGENSEIIAAEKKRAGRFILATSILETQELSASEILRASSRTTSSRKRICFFKRPLVFCVKRIFLKTAERIETMAMSHGLMFIGL